MRTRLYTLNNERMRMTQPGEKKAVPVRCNYLTDFSSGVNQIFFSNCLVNDECLRWVKLSNTVPILRRNCGLLIIWLVQE
ncbi:hypothetical protein NDU88_004560 [Pleurodeles waltl]|uniref:Uncharacterized protein n=1 Tax=Pleurodeles waltl TaxID=8319 RepID=A0AAV7W5L4_PLEWA|nr:hypothetical protein NDU88_004560 [Pleurodeles waltl]